MSLSASSSPAGPNAGPDFKKLKPTSNCSAKACPTGQTTQNPTPLCKALFCVGWRACGFQSVCQSAVRIAADVAETRERARDEDPVRRVREALEGEQPRLRDLLGAKAAAVPTLVCIAQGSVNFTVK